MNRALLVGINAYPNSPLRGCVNDVVDMATFLTQRCGFKHDEVRLLVDRRATTAAILSRLNWLVAGLRTGDRVLFQFSGHGVQLPTRAGGGEVDGLDEAICPVDFDWSEERAIRDKDFARIFAGVPSGVEFVWISDSCHSGDLSRDMRTPLEGLARSIPAPADIEWRAESARANELAPTALMSSAPQHFGLISGCESAQTSADANFGGRPNGALTRFLLDALHQDDGLEHPLTTVISTVRSGLRQSGYSQVPQLEGDPIVLARPFLAK